MERASWFRLPAKRGGRPLGSRTEVPVTRLASRGSGCSARWGSSAVRLQPVTTGADHRWWRELMGRYHRALGYRMPIGAQLRYLAFVSEPTRTVVAALQISSPAWRLAARDRWIGWDEPTRVRNLQRVVNNSRFLVLPWVRVQNLASRLLACWPSGWRSIGRRASPPSRCCWRLDGSRFAGTCYRAANWIERRHDRVAGAWTAPMHGMGRHRSGCWCILWWRRSAPAGAGLSDGRCAGVGERDTG